MNASVVVVVVVVVVDVVVVVVVTVAVVVVFVVVVGVVVVVDSGFGVEFVGNMGNWVVGVSVVVELTPVFVVPTTLWVIVVAFVSF